MTTVPAGFLKVLAMLIRWLIPLSLIAASPASAAPEGDWVARIGDAAFWRISIRKIDTGWSGTWSRPAHFTFAEDGFSTVEGPVVHRDSLSMQAIGDSIEFSFKNPRLDATPNILRFRETGTNTAQIEFAGIPPGVTLPTINMVRDSATPLGPWDRNRLYALAIAYPTNAEMAAIFKADQEDRRDPVAIDWAIVGERDRQRRERTQALLEAGQLASGEDFYHAAFVFQHGGSPENYLKAHTLAMAAMARGHKHASWIAAATLDRYLQSIDRAQIFGTQYRSGPDSTMGHGQYDRDLIPDTLRKALRAPTAAEQERQRLYFEEQSAERMKQKAE